MTRRFTTYSALLAMLALTALIGCQQSTPTQSTSSGSTAHHDDHGRSHHHAAEGPHHGHLLELGADQYHAELTHDDATHTVTVYLLDKEAKAPVAIAEPEIALNLVVNGTPLQAMLAAMPQEGDPEGKASRFVLTDEAVCEALDASTTTGRLNVTIDGQSYSAEVERHAHGEHAH